MKTPTNHAEALLSVEFNRIFTLLERQDLRIEDRVDWTRRLVEVKNVLTLTNNEGIK